MISDGYFSKVIKVIFDEIAPHVQIFLHGSILAVLSQQSYAVNSTSNWCICTLLNH